MKKIFTLLCIALCATSLFANVVTGTCGDNLQWAYDTDTHALTITGSGDMWDYQDIERPWGQVAYEITSVSLPDGLTSIGDYAFSGCSISTIIIPYGVTRIGSGAFSWCDFLGDILIPCTVTSIGYQAFWLGDGHSINGTITYFYITAPTLEEYCNSSVNQLLEDFYYSRRLVIAGQELTEVVLPNSVTSIREYLFSDMQYLTSITIPNSVVNIGRSVFEDCHSLKSITIPNSVTHIGNDAFYDCSSLTYVNYTGDIANWCDIYFESYYANPMRVAGRFYINDQEIKNVVIPNSVERINNYAFSGCNFTSVTIPSSVTSIGDDALSSCSQVTMQGTTPPSIAANTFGDNTTILVPCSAMDAYLAAPVWQFLDLHGLNYNVNLTATEGGSAQITATDCESSSVTVEAYVSENYQFKQWSDGNTDNPRTLTLTRDITLTAEFEEIPYYSVTISGNYIDGYVSIWDWHFYTEFSAVQFEVQGGTEVYFREESNCGLFLGWSDGVTERERTIVITSDTTIYSIIEKPKYYTVNISGDNLCGSYEVEGGMFCNTHWTEFYNNSSLQLTMREGTSISVREDGGCSTFLGWSDGVTDNERIITITSDTTISSRFDVATYSVSITAGEGGYLEYGNIEREYNECNRDWIYTCAYAYDGYYFVGWSDGNTSQCISIYPETDINLVAQFAPKKQVQLLLGVDNACKNMGSVSGSGIYYSGDYVTITATPNAGYHFVEWSDGSGLASREIYLQQDTTLFATFAAGEYGGKCGENLFWTFNNGHLSITGTGDMDLDNYPAWNNYYEDWYDNVTAVQFPEGITSIDDYAFSGMSLTSIIVPESVTYFGAGAFANNYYLTRFEYLGTTAEYNYDYPILYHCDNLRYFKGTQDMVWDWDHYYNLDTIIVTSGEGCGYYEARYIDNSRAADWYIEGDYAANVVEVETLILQNGLQEIGNYALYNARHLGQITIPAGVTRIGESAFEECRSLESVTFAGKALREIDDWAFYNCHSLKNITIPEGVTEIGKAAFFDCSYLKEITLPSSVQTIADNAFGQCQKVAKMTVNAMTPPVVEAETFEDIDRSIPLYVPMGTALQYKEAEYWCEFFNVIEYNAPSAVENTNSPTSKANCQKTIRNGQLIIVRDGVEYNAMGAQIQ